MQKLIQASDDIIQVSDDIFQASDNIFPLCTKTIRHIRW